MTSWQYTILPNHPKHPTLAAAIADVSACAASFRAVATSCMSAATRLSDSPHSYGQDSFTVIFTVTFYIRGASCLVSWRTTYVRHLGNRIYYVCTTVVVLKFKYTQ